MFQMISRCTQDLPLITTRAIALSPCAHPLLIPIAIALLRIPQNRIGRVPDRDDHGPIVSEFEGDDCRAFPRRRDRPDRWSPPQIGATLDQRRQSLRVWHAPGWQRCLRGLRGRHSSRSCDTHQQHEGPRTGRACHLTRVPPSFG